MATPLEVKINARMVAMAMLMDSPDFDQTVFNQLAAETQALRAQQLLEQGVATTNAKGEGCQ